MTKASDNPFPAMTYVEGTTPSSPSAGRQKLFVRSSDHVLCMVDSSGTVVALSGSLTNPMTTAGDIVVGGSAGVPTRLAIGAAGKVPVSSGSALAYAYPPGFELDYAENTSSVSPTATGSNEAGTDLVLAGNAVTHDGTAVWVEYSCSDAQADATVGRFMQVFLFDGSTALGWWIIFAGTSDGSVRYPILLRRKITLSAGSHTLKIRASVSAGTGNLRSGSAGSGEMPMFLRVTKA